MAPDFDIKWAKKSYDVALDLINQDKIDAILSSGPPFSTFITAILLKKKIDIPVVLDFRDGWVGNPYFQKKGKIFINWQNKVIENKAVKIAHSALFVTDPLLQIYQHRYPQYKNKFELLTNGFDAEDISYAKNSELLSNQLSFVHCGTISGDRSPESFLKGLQLLLDENPSLQKTIRVNFIGKFKFDNKILLNKMSKILSIEGPYNHSKAISKMAKADIFIFISNPRLGGKTVMTGKIFEYLALNKPIFSISDDCAATDLLKELDIGYYAKYNDIDQIKNIFQEIYNDWQNNRLKTINKRHKIDNFNRRNITRSLANLLDQLTVKRI